MIKRVQGTPREAVTRTRESQWIVRGWSLFLAWNRVL